MKAETERLTSAVEIATAIRSGAVSVVDVAQATIDRIEKQDAATTNAFTLITRERAIREAAVMDQLRAKGGEYRLGADVARLAGC